MVDILHKVGEKAKGLGDIAREVTRKSGELLEVTKLKYEISKLEKEIENNFAGLGALVYQKFKGAGDTDGEVDRLLKNTATLENEIKELEKQIDKLNPKTLSCPECKVDLPAGGKFCSYCGTRILKDEDPGEGGGSE
ncbi:MAG: zinc ribbon domain-containing protein [Bacillota bacterium]